MGGKKQLSVETRRQNFNLAEPRQPQASWGLLQELMWGLTPHKKT